MMRAVVWIRPVLLALAASIGAASAGQVSAGASRSAPVQLSPEEAQAGWELLSAGDRSAAEGRYPEALHSWKRAFEKLFPTYRDMAFRAPVTAEYLRRHELRAMLSRDLRQQDADGSLAEQTKALVCFGFVAPGLDLKRTMMDVLRDEVAGFYDPETKKLYLIRERERRQQPRSWWEKLAEKVVLIHEMAHALVDQQFDLRALDRRAAGDDDMSLAVTALIEGDATLCMIVAGRDRSVLSAPPALFNFSLSLTRPLMALSGSDSFRKAPAIFRESLMFPYMKGLSFCLSLTSPSGSWQPVNAAFENPPTSSEQILHPDRYPGDTPTRLWFADLRPALGAGWSPVFANVLGELQTRVLLAEKIPGADATLAADGWDGDYFRVYERGDTHELLLAWASTWDSPAEAEQFREAYARFLTERLGGPPTVGDGIAGIPTGAWSRVWETETHRTALLARGADVWALQGIPRERFAQVAATVLTTNRAPKHLPPAGKR
jgi:hypothetical protein